MNYKYEKKKGLIYNSLLFFKLNLVYNLTILVACIILGSLTNDIYRALFTGILLYFWAYFIHVLAHKLPSYINPHKYHHMHHINDKWWAILIELLVNLFGSGGLSLLLINVLLEKKMKIKILNNYTLLYTALLYSTFHMINYHYLNVSTHNFHHEFTKFNYGPDIIDILFNTKINNDEIENMNHGILNSVVILMIILLVYDSKYDLVKIINNI